MVDELVTMVHSVRAGRAAATERDDRDAQDDHYDRRERPPKAIVHGIVRGMTNTPTRATAATILATKTRMSGEEIQAGVVISG
jgi:hypothetical protein